MEAYISIRDSSDPAYGELTIGDHKRLDGLAEGDFFLHKEISYQGKRMVIDSIDIMSYDILVHTIGEDDQQYGFDCIILLYCKALNFNMKTILEKDEEFYG